jgi:hypothetical protein
MKQMMLLTNPLRWSDPRTWPWMFYFWLALVAAGWLKPLWRWIQRNRAKSWPIATGQIESAAVSEPKRSFISSGPRASSHKFVAELSYSYWVEGNLEKGIYKRDFSTDAEALEFQRDLKGKPVAVHYNPSRPSNSTLSEASVETLLQTRPPKSDSEQVRSAPTNSIPPLVSRFLWVFVVLSAVGLVVSFWVPLGAIAGRRVAPVPFFWILHIGIFVVWLPAVLVARQQVGNLRTKDSWKAALRGSPDWMRYMVYGFSGYAIINFALFIFRTPTGHFGAEPPAIFWRVFSGHWMAFYSAALAILYSAATISEPGRRCVNGHLVPTSANFCERCGQPVVHT